ncbi:MAG: hypothetical protein JXA93_12285 [Anaerolineae bacterium]|nr:hypothetical protein [Anaerolineae bacterium]
MIVLSTRGRMALKRPLRTGSRNVTVHTRIGQDGSPPASFYWDRVDPAWWTGETATLRNAIGETVATYLVSP